MSAQMNFKNFRFVASVGTIFMGNVAYMTSQTAFPINILSAFAE